MKKTLLTTAALTLMAAPVYAQGCNAGCQLNRLENNPQLRTAGNIVSAMREIDNEDQRLVSGTYDPTTGTLTLQTQDMRAGADGDISRRDVVITGLEARDGTNGTNGTNGADAVFPQADFDNMMARYGSGLAASTALGGLELRTPGEGQWSVSGGIGGVNGFEAVSFGASYGLTNSVRVYAKVSQSLQGNSTAWFVGVEALLGGGQ